jgi:hypothetical protein
MQLAQSVGGPAAIRRVLAVQYIHLAAVVWLHAYMLLHRRGEQEQFAAAVR